MVLYLFGIHIINFIRSFSSRVEKYLIVYVHASNISQHWKREFLPPRSYQISSIYQANMGHFEGWNSFTRKNLMESVQLMLEFTSQSRVGRKAHNGAFDAYSRGSAFYPPGFDWALPH